MNSGGPNVQQICFLTGGPRGGVHGERCAHRLLPACAAARLLEERSEEGGVPITCIVNRIGKGVRDGEVDSVELIAFLEDGARKDDAEKRGRAAIATAVIRSAEEERNWPVAEGPRAYAAAKKPVLESAHSRIRAAFRALLVEREGKFELNGDEEFGGRKRDEGDVFRDKRGALEAVKNFFESHEALEPEERENARRVLEAFLELEVDDYLRRVAFNALYAVKGTAATKAGQ